MAVTRVYNDLLLAADMGQVSALCLLDLTAAFDTVDHELLSLRLERQFGLCGTALMWFRSYLSGRTSESCTPVVPHLLCTLSAQSLAQYCSCCTWLTLRTLLTDRHGVTLHSFANDTQLYLHSCREDITTAATRLKECIIDVGR